MMSFSRMVWLLAEFCFLTLILTAAAYVYRTHWHEERKRADVAIRQVEAQQQALARLESQRSVAETDQKYTQELSKANEEIETLRADLSAGRKWLYVKAEYPKLPETTTAPGLDNAGPARLGRDSEQDYLRLRQQVMQMQKKSEALQGYFNKITKEQ